jgi:hypothetical protein
MGSVRSVQRGMGLMSNCGCIYVAFGRPYLVQALHSFRTLRETNPSVPACVLTNTLPQPPDTLRDWDGSKDVWIYVDAADSENRLYKTDLPRYTPFEKTLYLDSDTEVHSDISGMFKMLDYWDVALHLRPSGYPLDKPKGRQRVLDGEEIIANLPHWNGGVVLFRRDPKVEEFFSLWNQYFRASGIPFDQVALVEAAFRSSCRILSLDARWNSGPTWVPERHEKRYIFHYTFRIDDKLAGRLTALEREIFGSSGEPLSGTGAETSAFISHRQQILRDRNDTRLWRLIKRQVRGLARIVKAAVR